MKHCFGHIKQIFYIFFLISLLSCNEKKEPAYPITDEEFIQLFKELHYARYMVEYQTTLSLQERQSLLHQFKNDIFTQHNINEEIFEEILLFYDVEKLDSLISTLKDALILDRKNFYKK